MPPSWANHHHHHHGNMINPFAQPQQPPQLPVSSGQLGYQHQHGQQQASAKAGPSGSGSCCCCFKRPSPRTCFLTVLVLIGVVVLATVLAAVLAGRRRGGSRGEEAPQVVQPPGALPPEVASAFVRVSPHTLQLERQCVPLLLVGFNAYDLTQVAMVDAAHGAGGMSGQQHIRLAMQQAAGEGMNVLRTWAHTSNPSYPFQVAPGLYDEHGLRALDFVLHAAAQSGLHVVLSLVDMWKYYNGVDNYVDWSRTAPPRTQPRPADTQGDAIVVASAEGTPLYEARRRALFWTDPDCRAMYKAHVSALVHRRNSYNGRLYRDDPTIMAWSLVNEPRCESWAVEGCHSALHAWIVEMSAYVKSVDPNHLVMIGSEGFFGPSTPQLQVLNPARWAADTGQDFVANNLVPNIDVATVHVWPENWRMAPGNEARLLDFTSEYVSTHINLARSVLRKPLLVEEFGRKVCGADQSAQLVEQLRDPVFTRVYGVLQQQAAAAVAVAQQPLELQPKQQPYITSGAGTTPGSSSSNNAMQIIRLDPDVLGIVSSSSGSSSRQAQVADGLPAAATSAPGQRSAVAGSLFWKLQVPVFLNSVASECYAVPAGVPSTTLTIAAQHATYMQQLASSNFSAGGGSKATALHGSGTCLLKCFVGRLEVVEMGPLISNGSLASGNGTAVAGGGKKRNWHSGRRGFDGLSGQNMSIGRERRWCENLAVACSTHWGLDAPAATDAAAVPRAGWPSASGNSSSESSANATVDAEVLYAGGLFDEEPRKVVFASLEACCKPRSGAFTDGCTDWG